VPNVFKYNTSSTEIQSLRRGNFYIGIGDVAKGPTPDTGFWNGVIVGTFSYVIVLHRGENVPTFYQIQNDAELILRTNQIDKSVVRTTKEECFSYFSGQSDKMIVNRDYESVVTDGLVLNFDASYIPSYPATGSSWYNLGPTQSNGTLENSPVFSAGGWITFDGSNNYINVSSSVNVGNPNTICALIKLSSSNADTIIYGPNANGQDNWLGINGNRLYMFVTQAADVNNVTFQGTTTLDTTNTRWYFVTSIVSGSSATLYLNGIQENTTSQAFTIASWSGTLAIGRRGAVSQRYFNGSIKNVLGYSRALSQSEILQNYYLGRIITDSLVVMLDAANQVSYNKETNSWYNLSGVLYNGTFQNSPTYSNVNNGVIDFDGTSAWVQISTYTFGNGNWTCNVWVQGDLIVYSGTGNIVSNSSGGPVTSAMGFVSSKIHYRNYDGAWKSNSGNTTLSAGRWYMLTWVNYAGATAGGGTMKMFVDGLADSSVFNSYTTNGGPCDAIGRNWFSYFNGKIGVVQFYNKSLSDSEVTQNFSAYRSRYAI